MDAVTVRVPGTTSNLGPGFDCLGVAMRLYNHVRVSRSRGVGKVTSAMGRVDDAARSMVRLAGEAFFQYAGKKAIAYDIDVKGDVPMARGMGSSVTVRLGIVAGLNALTNAKLDRAALLSIINELEHHPDNAAPAIFGGFTVAGMVGEQVRCLQFPVARGLRFVALIPDFEISTEAARRLVPAQFSKADTVHNLNRAAFIAAAFASERYDELREMFEDRVHQPYREKLLPQLTKIIAAGCKAGAIGGWLSGSGSTVMCLARSNTAPAVAKAMRRELPQSIMKILAADNDGVKVIPRRAVRPSSRPG